MDIRVKLSGGAYKLTRVATGEVVPTTGAVDGGTTARGAEVTPSILAAIGAGDTSTIAGEGVSSGHPQVIESKSPLSSTDITPSPFVSPVGKRALRKAGLYSIRCGSATTYYEGPYE